SFRHGAGASVSALVPFPAAAHRTGRAALPHPALGGTSRAGMRGSSLTAPLEVEKVQHAPFSVDLLPSEAAGPYVQLVAATEEPADPMRHVGPHGLVGLLGRPEAEVFG